jgi:hypothetical protein
MLITLLLAFLIGGYAAGRMASRSGLKHGLLVPLLALVVTLVLAIIGGLLGVSFIDQLSGVTLPQGAQQSAQQAAPQQGLGTILSVSGILALQDFSLDPLPIFHLDDCQVVLLLEFYKNDV